MIHVVELERVPPQRWKNGGGETRELLAWPGADDWKLRISVADIDADGPFSLFRGVQRCFAVIEGAGVTLQFGDRRETLVDASPPLEFDGAEAPDCLLLSGATRDLNLMVRRDAGQGAMADVAAGAEWFSTSAWRALFTRHGATLQIDDTDAARLLPMSLAWSDHASRQRWRLVDDGSPVRAWWLQFEATAA